MNGGFLVITVRRADPPSIAVPVGFVPRNLAITVGVQTVTEFGGAGMHLGPGVVTLEAITEPKAVAIEVSLDGFKYAVTVVIEAIAEFLGPRVDRWILIVAVLPGVEAVPVLVRRPSSESRRSC